jgi:hydrogenase-4 component F
VGIFALLGFPPFASFLAEMLILSGIVQAGNLMAFTLMCVMLTVHFCRHRAHRVPHAVGAPQGGHARATGAIVDCPAAPAGFVAVLVMLGTYTPDRFTELLRAVAVSIGG